MAANAWAQSDARFDKQLEIYRRTTDLTAENRVPADERALIDYGLYLIPSYLSLDDPNGNNHVLHQYDALGYARVNLDSAQEFFFLGRISYLDFNPGDSFDGRGDEHQERVERLFYHFDLAQFNKSNNHSTGDYDVAATAGRQLVFWGNGLALSEDLDGATIDLTAGHLTLEFLAGMTPQDAVDIDSTRPRFDEDTHRGFFGAMLTAHVGSQRPYIYALAQRDYNDEDLSQRGAITTRYEYNSNYFGLGSRGPISDRLLYGVELSAETGSTMSNSVDAGGNPIPQTDDDIEALAADVQLDYVFSEPHKTRLSFETILASGDPDRLSTNNTFGGNRTHTDDHAFNSFGLLNTGFVFNAPVSNLLSFRLGATTFPFPDKPLLEHLQCGVDMFAFAKTQKDAPIDEGTSDDRYLGCEPDLFLNWQLTEDLTLAARYGLFFPGQAISGDNTPRQGIFLSVAYAF
ncbi:MAG TPA: alginate export family protein [Tepidisphaeraceae bacterium]|jgi:hypothetical protein|nr:alginate export family protein [Tepidisphaeraceae bacterium]